MAKTLIENSYCTIKKNYLRDVIKNGVNQMSQANYDKLLLIYGL